MTHSINKVREFHQAFGHPVEDHPNCSTSSMRAFRVRLMAEELGEVAKALGVKLDLRVDPHAAGEGSAGVFVYCETVKPAEELDLPNVAKELADLDYVVQGTNLCLGFPAEAVFDEVHASNMSKLGADGKPIYRDDGKVLKGPNYVEPDIYEVLFPQ